ncbi:MAG TPA: hypothetical protein VN541_06145 [Tepidisphaeraceae bacterium]|nr:hypothetical protein [Tepidisphaeraceae bacterium]
MPVGSRPPQTAPAARTIALNRDWRFGGKFNPAATAPVFDDGAFTPVNLPHSVARLSWENWEPAAWENVWVYRKHFAPPSDFKGLRVFLDFEGVMVGVRPTINGHTLSQPLGAISRLRTRSPGISLMGTTFWRWRWTRDG